MSGSGYAVFCGLDVGKSKHHAVALAPDGARLHDHELSNDEQQLRTLFNNLRKHGEVVVVVDQPASIGALPVAVAQAMNIDVGYLPGLAMRRMADLYPGNSKTDARDAFVIADAARTLPQTLRSTDIAGPALANLGVLTGYDQDLRDQITAATNRLRNLILSVHPGLERALGDDLTHPAVLALLAKYGGPAGLTAAGRRRIDNQLKKRAPRIHTRLTEAIMAALSQQTVVIAGTSAVEAILPSMATALAGLIDARAAVAKDVEKALDAHPLAKVLTSMPGVGVGTAAVILVEIGDASSFPTAAHLASYAGLAPVTRRSGSSIKGEHPNRAGQQTTQERPVPIRVRRSARPRITGLLRPQTRREEETQRSHHLPRPTPPQRHLRHAARRHLLPAQNRPKPLDNFIGTPPSSCSPPRMH